MFKKEKREPLGEALRSIDMTTSKIYGSRIFIPDCNKVEILRLMPKSAGFDVYLPRSLAEALNLSKSDHSLIAFIDDEGSYPYIVITKDSSLAEELRPWIFEKRRKAEILHKELKRQIQQKEVKQGDIVFDAEVEK